MTDFIEIDGSHGEGGGQILRTVVSLSALTGKPIRVKNIRANRPKPGLKMQHLVGIKAVRDLSNGKADGLRLGSSEVTFEPGELRGGNFSLNIQTAGSITLLLQSVMPLLPFVPTPISARVQGGTDVNWSPPLNYTTRVLLPQLEKMGYKANIKLIKRGYFPEGGGVLTGKSTPVKHLKPLELTSFEEVDYVGGMSHCLNYPREVAEEMASAAKAILRDNNLDMIDIEIDSQTGVTAPSKGAGLDLWAVTEDGAIIGSSALMEKKQQSGQEIGEKAATTLLAYLKSKTPVDPHLQDQLLIYMALAKGESHYLTGELTDHSTTTMWAIEQLLPVKFKVSPEERDGVKMNLVSVEGVGFKNKFLN